MPIVIAAVPWLHPHRIFPAPKLQYFRYHPMLLHCMVLSDKQSISTLESESVAAVAMLNNALAGRNRCDVSRFRLSSVKLRNHKVGYFDPLLRALRVTIIVETFCIGGQI